VINARLDGLVIAREFRIDDVVVHEPALTSLSLYPYLHRSHQQLVTDLASALDAMKADGTFVRIQREVMQPHDRDVAE
jgi:hypothetical protein